MTTKSYQFIYIMMIKKENNPVSPRKSRFKQYYDGLDGSDEKEEDKKTAVLKRRVSCNDAQMLKYMDKVSKTRKAHTGLENKVNYKMGSEVLSFEMEEQRSLQMNLINENDKLKEYYIAFKKLFIILFQASHFLMENMFKISTQMYQNKQVMVLCLLFERDKDKWTLPFLNTLMILARNVIYMASSPSEFERRIDLVARKVTINNEKKQKITNAFLNAKIQKNWEKHVEAFFQDEETETFVEDQFDSAEEKMCFIEIKDFVVNRLATEAFGSELRRYCSLEQIDEDMNLDFKFQFLLTAQFSFNQPEVLKKQPKAVQTKKVRQPQSECLLM